eukprot:CAMPEP_0175071642 /NCGR_PEP_ID=MMETSP0052_2-20121109/19357_1 /TAXON_ID=51329 ORGANISM="Polytomella parva, Strain SAG 63-3" /NCGR_SAMPLE_ID=MMETSP0052_2 /ASSEMBLY_ACC=CAM_ASM_000194 /LENGTH=57 /DNA_ID=CAMNT_0016338837 /DNA_START=456 /DNA_END=629 /DNA_ORIENTATION=+
MAALAAAAAAARLFRSFALNAAAAMAAVRKSVLEVDVFVDGAALELEVFLLSSALFA